MVLSQTGRNRLSESVKHRHELAQKRQNLYNELTGENGNYKDFFQNKDIIRENIVVYDVSLQVSYASAKNELKMDTAITYKVYALRNAMSDERIYAETENALFNAKGTNGKVNSKTSNKVLSNRMYNNIDIVPIRGMEISDEEIKDEVIQKLAKTKTGFYVKEQDVSFKYKNKRGYTSDMKMNLNNYFNK